MNEATFNTKDINIGDEVLLDETHETHHNLYWRVVNKLSENRLMVEIKEMGYAKKFIVSIKAIVNVEPAVVAF